VDGLPSAAAVVSGPSCTIANGRAAAGVVLPLCHGVWPPVPVNGSTRRSDAGSAVATVRVPVWGGAAGAAVAEAVRAEAPPRSSATTYAAGLVRERQVIR
jgi:hypothetical protein